MSLNTPENINYGEFVIENNIVKSVSVQLDENYNLGKLIFETLNSKPNHVAQIEAEKGIKTTFFEMKNYSVRCALWMEKQGINSGDIVTLVTHNHLDVYIPIFATFFLGATHNAWNHLTTTDIKAAQNLMKKIKPKLIFSCENAADILFQAAKLENVNTKIIVFGSHPHLQSLRNIIEDQSKEEVQSFCPRTIKSPCDVALIIMTSGSTGSPKGVMYSYGSILPSIVSFFPYTMKGVSLWYSTCDWVTCFSFMLMSFFSYGTRIIHSKFDVEETCQVIEKFQVEWAVLGVNLINYIVKENVLEKYDFKFLKYSVTMGYKVSAKIFEEFVKRMHNTLVFQIYGISEVSTVTSQTEKRKSVSSIGFITPWRQLKIVDNESGKILGPNEPGELYIKSPTIMLGYFNDPEATKEVLDDDGWFHSGDKIYYDSNGEFFYVDRLKDFMKYQACHISPSEIEELLYSHPSVMEVSVVSLPHEVDGDRPIAYVKKVSGSKVTEEELIQLSSTLGEKKKLSGGVQFLEDLPKTTTGKIDRKQLRKMAELLAKKI